MIPTKRQASANDLAVLDGILKDSNHLLAPDLPADAYFEFFCGEQILKPFGMSNDQINAGLVGNSSDGGLDGMYTLVDGTPVDIDFDFASVKKNATIDVVVFQAKRSAKFESDPLHRILTTLGQILNLQLTAKNHAKYFNEELLARIELFKQTIIKTALRQPSIAFHVVYASRGDRASVQPDQARIVKEIETTISKYFPDAKAYIRFLGATQLLDSALSQDSQTLGIRLTNTPILGRDNSYIALVTLEDYYKFLVGEDGVLRSSLFEANVRDFQGAVEVNENIQDTLSNKDLLDFWWLNNGITIVASNVSLAGGILSIEDPQVVNGLQTSRIIFAVLSRDQKLGEGRSVLVRIIVTNEDEARNRIIQATNSQNSMPSAALRATDPFQRRIEEFFKLNGLYYDRRKNFYKNLGKPIASIVSIEFLAQCVMATLLKQPDNARARPTTLIKKTNDYGAIFNPDRPLDLYVKVTKIVQAGDRQLRNYATHPDFVHRTNFRFHLAAMALFMELGPDYVEDDVLKLDTASLTEHVWFDAFNTLVQLFVTFRQDNHFWPADRIAKSKQFVDYMMAAVSGSTLNKH